MRIALDDNTVLKSTTGLDGSVQDLEAGSGLVFIHAYYDESAWNLEDCPLQKRLRDLHQKGDVPSDETITRWAGQLIDGLDYIYSKEVLQADVGCHNLLFEKNDDLKLCGFAGASIDGDKATVVYERRSRNTIVGPNIATKYLL